MDLTLYKKTIIIHQFQCVSITGVTHQYQQNIPVSIKTINVINL